MRGRSIFNKKITKAGFAAGIILISLFLLSATVGVARPTKEIFPHSMQIPENMLITMRPFFPISIDYSPIISQNPQNEVREEDFAEGKILVKFKPQVSELARNAIANAYGLKQESVISQIDVFIFKVPEHAREKVLAALQKNPNIEFAEAEQIFQPDLTTNDALRDGSQYPHGTMRLPQAWDISTGSTIVRVSNPDTGIDVAHPDLAPNLLIDLAYNSADGSTNVNPVYPHGTGTAGCIGAKTNNGIGIASSSWYTEIIPIRVTNRDDGYASSTAISKAIIYAADNGAKVVSVSYGVGGLSSINSAGQYLRQKTNGLLFVSAGNQNSYISSVNYPYILVIGATDSKDNRATFSNYGPFVDLVAPGVSVYSTSGSSGYSSMSGTSFSSPLAASVAAYLFSVNPSATAEQVEQALFMGATDLGASGRDDYFGYGRVDALGAITYFNSGELPEPPEPDTTPPTVSLTSPASDSTVSGTINIEATASDNVGVTKVEFYQGTKLIATDTTTPYSCSWDTTSATNGAYTLQAKAYDEANNIGVSALVEVTVNNQIPLSFPSKPPSITAFKNEVIIKWNTNIASTGIIYYGTSQKVLNLQQIDSAVGTSHETTLTGLSANKKYYFMIVAINADNPNESVSTNILNFRTKNK